MSNRSAKDFLKILDDLEDSKAINRTKSRELFEVFEKQKKEKETPRELFDINWVKEQAKSNLNQEDFNMRLDELAKEKAITSF